MNRVNKVNTHTMQDGQHVEIELRRVYPEPTVCWMCGDLVAVGPVGLCVRGMPEKRFCVHCADRYAPEAAAALRGAVERAMGG